MAITIEQQPSSTLYVPVNNPIEYLVSSTNTSEPNFKLSCKVIVGSTEIKELMYDVIPSTAYVIAEVQKLLQSAVGHGEQNLLDETTTMRLETSMKVASRAVFQEFYSSSVTSEPTYQGSQASGVNSYVWGGAFKYREWVDNEWQDYSIDGQLAAPNFTPKPLTAFSNLKSNYTYDAPNGSAITNLSKTDRFKKVTPTQLSRLIWQVYDLSTSQGLYVLTGFYKSDFSTIGSSPTTYPTGQDQLNNASLISGVVNGFNVYSKNFDKDSLTVPANYNFSSNQLALLLQANGWKYFSLFCRTTFYAASHAALYEIDWDACSKYDSYEIHWLNHLGGWDSWVFNKRSSIDIITDREFYVQPNQRRIVSDTIVHDQYARKKTQFYTSRSERYTVNSDILKDWEYDGLVDLLQSPQVYWRHPDYGFIAINILDQDVTRVPRQQDDKTYNLSFVFEIQNFDKLQSF